jgi:putative phosphoserine phosphatase/1-acylglycerol-3-phosphate O-acyltransferase
MPNNNKRIAAFFDFDKTLIAVDSSSKEAATIIAEKCQNNVFSIIGLLLATIMNPWVERNWLSTESVNIVYCFSYRNVLMDELKTHSQQLYTSLLRKTIYPEMLEILNGHRKKGHLIVVLSATSEHLIQPFAKEHGIDVCIATKLKTMTNNKQYCSGQVDGKVCCQYEKARHVQRIANEYDLDLSDCYAYSDHHHDVPMLDSVGHAIAVNPTPILEEIAKKRDWQVMRPITKPTTTTNNASEVKDSTNIESEGSTPVYFILFCGIASILIIILAWIALRFLLTILMFGGEGGWNL